MQKVLVTRRLPSKVIARLEQRCEVDLHDGEGLTPAELRERVHDKHALVCLLTDRIDAAVIDAGRNLRIIADVAVGYDNIDLAQAEARGIVVTNTPDVLTEAVAEFTWGLILSVTRRITEGDRLVRAGGWKRWALDFMLGAELGGKQLGIVGLGRIGRAVAARAPAFGMSVVYHRGDHRTRLKPRATTAGGTSLQARPSSFDELLVTSDVVSIHTPLTPDTRHLIDQRALARMKRTAYLINTSRGPVVDEAALAWALRERLIAGAALDVYEKEPIVPPDLLSLDNVVLAPHLGSATRETRTAMADLAVSNVLAVLDGKPAITPV
ncbi:MAG: 2-hydroxyacid dehydrogenase [Vicinamibacterales bacterium]